MVSHPSYTHVRSVSPGPMYADAPSRHHFNTDLDQATLQRMRVYFST